MASRSDDPRTDAELIDAARGGDAAAFEVLYRRHRDWVVRLAHRWTGDPQTALDVLQESFLYLLRRLPGLELRARFTTLLYPVVRHLALAGERRRRREGGTEDVPEPAAGDDDPTDLHGDLVHVLGALPPGQREVVLLRYVDDLPLAAVAEALAIPLGTVKSRLHQALRTLREDPAARAYFRDDEQE